MSASSSNEPKRSYPIHFERAAQPWHTPLMVIVLMLSVGFPALLGVFAHFTWGDKAAYVLLALMTIATVALIKSDRTWRRWCAIVALLLPIMGLLIALFS